MTTKLNSVSKSQHKSSKDVDWELVEDFKQALEDLKAGRYEEFKKGSLLH